MLAAANASGALVALLRAALHVVARSAVVLSGGSGRPSGQVASNA